jgi:hypothetical protein
MLWKDRITTSTNCHPQAGKLLGTVGEHQAEADVLNEPQRCSFIMHAQARSPAEPSVPLVLQVIN